MNINTRTVKDRRKVRFENVVDAVGNAEALAEAERRGALRAVGNWTLGQAIGHVAAWANYAFDGYPAMPRPPWFVRVLVPVFKNYFLNKGLPAGAKLGKVPGGTFGIEPMDTDRAIGELRAAFERLDRQAPPGSHPLLGAMTHDDWIKLNLRHAELHFSFFHPA